jgi:uncharacterized protein DUF3168
MSVIDPRPGLRTFLLADPAISAAVGNERIFPIVLPHGITAPSVVYNRVSGIGDHHMQGASGLYQTRFQIDAWGMTQALANGLANMLKDRLDGFKGLMGSVVCQGAFFNTEREDYDQESKLFRVSRDYLCWFEER